MVYKFNVFLLSPHLYLYICVLFLYAELHLAAQLGKTLLERNGNLEEQLKRLEQYAEDTLITNQVMNPY